jgi:hypothetical protein
MDERVTVEDLRELEAAVQRAADTGALDARARDGLARVLAEARERRLGAEAPLKRHGDALADRRDSAGGGKTL